MLVVFNYNDAANIKEVARRTDFWTEEIYLIAANTGL
jgi:hypothetical protein